VDVRELQGNFLSVIQKKAGALKVGQGLHIINSFEPVPLCSVLGDIGFEHTIRSRPRVMSTTSTFVSEISTSPAFGAYELAKKTKKQGKTRGEILSALMDKFGERHPNVGVF